jgi:8-oxo-dGTP pyrophosphatase MutT (NUDIX family)
VSNQRQLYDATIFQLFTHRVQRGSFEADYHFLECPDWVNVIALTPGDEVVMIEQYRTTLNRTFLELPGGLLDHEDPSPEFGARRELLEETGYTAHDFLSLGAVHPNPALQRNQAHYFLATGAVCSGSQNLDGGEDLRVVCVPLKEIPERIRSGELSHALMLAAFAKLFALRG